MKNNYHIMFDGRMIGHRISGVARHLINLINGLNEVAPKNKYTVIVNNKDALEHLGDKVDIVWAKSKPLYPSEYFEIPKFILKYKPDIFHSPYFSPKMPELEIPFIVTIHDLSVLSSKANMFKYLYYKKLMKRACRMSDKVITVSEYSKQQISKRLSVPEEHIEVVYNGIQDKFFKPMDEKKRMDVKRHYQLPDSYILYVGGSDARKNIKGIVQAYLKAGEDLPLVVALEWDEIKNYCRNFDRKPDKIICIGSVPDTDLPYIYKSAKLFVFTSFMEGFGLPLVEAFASGVPVVTSNVSSLPEISGGCAVEVDPRDINAISAAIRLNLVDEELRQRNIALGLERAKTFTISNMAEKVVRIYHDVIYA